jgi:thiol-disulfide isomerase/thioredoxin
MNLNKLKSKNFMTNPLCIIIMLLIGLIIVLAIFRTASPFLSVGFGLNAHIGELKGSFEIEAFDNQMKDAKNGKLFVMYYAEWCGHCKKTLPEFNKLMDNYKGKVRIIAIDSENTDNAELVKKQEIKGFPTIRYYPSGISEDYQEYNGERTHNGFMGFLNSV